MAQEQKDHYEALARELASQGPLDFEYGERTESLTRPFEQWKPYSYSFFCVSIPAASNGHLSITTPSCTAAAEYRFPLGVQVYAGSRAFDQQIYAFSDTPDFA